MAPRQIARHYCGAVRIVVLADTHIPDFARALPASIVPALRGTDLILHAGDVTAADVLEELRAYAPVRAAMGNNDRADVAAWGATEEVRLELSGIAIAMVHIGGPREGRERRLRRRFPDARVILFGHSHIPWNTEAGGVRYFNPGSPTWKRRQTVPTYGVLDVLNGRVRARIVELAQ
ncbi:MAG: metallophosphatase family protein [Chloroflexota bacterium]|nr:metallophosphatase family protein [Chloroflexota bacterium]